MVIMMGPQLNRNICNTKRIPNEPLGVFRSSTLIGEIMANPSMNDSANDADLEQSGIGNCAPLPVEMPMRWRGLPIQVSVSLILTGYNCVSREFYEFFDVASVGEAVDRLVEMEDEPLVYTFSVENAIPFLAYEAHWPLLRRSSQDCSVVPRVNVQGAEPSDSLQEQTLFEIYRKPFSDNGFNIWGDYSARPGGRLHLRVGGLSIDEATSDWIQCAKVLRGMYRDSRTSLHARKK